MSAYRQWLCHSLSKGIIYEIVYKYTFPSVSACPCRFVNAVLTGYPEEANTVVGKQLWL